MKYLFYLTILVLITFSAAAQNSNVRRINETTYAVGCFERPFQFDRIMQHNGGNDLFWDWAACLEMSLNYQGLFVTQDQVMSLVNGPIDAPIGTPQDLIVSANKTVPHDWSAKDAKVFTAMATIDPDVIFDEMKAGRPIIVGTRRQGEEGHAYVLIAMTYTINKDADGNQTGITPQTVILRDPWPTALANLTVNWQDFVPITASLYTVKVVFK